MKWIILLSIYSASTFACVDLTGVYKQCGRIQGSSTELRPGGFTIYKPVSNGIEFFINGKTILADDLTNTETPDQTGNDSDLTFASTCSDTELVRILRDPADPELEIKYTFSKRGNALIVKVTAKAPYDHINDLFVCD